MACSEVDGHLIECYVLHINRLEGAFLSLFVHHSFQIICELGWVDLHFEDGRVLVGELAPESKGSVHGSGSGQKDERRLATANKQGFLLYSLKLHPERLESIVTERCHNGRNSVKNYGLKST